NKPLTPDDLAALEQMLIDSGTGEAADIAQAKEQSAGLGLFVRSLVGLDREAAVEAFGPTSTGRSSPPTRSGSSTSSSTNSPPTV
ncbi:hypothetical protein, partial [Mycobacterium sp.]|uniref:hypothetical protein n=1 Tax=Mycobacterium sp. TaxID=1785 RepID=UPI003C7733C7